MSFSIVELMLDHGGYKCGYCSQKDTAYSQGMWAHKLNAIDYQDLIDRGWRRSGKYCYKPVMNKTCCPQYTIRCRAQQFKLTKSKKKVLNKMKQFLLNGDESVEIDKWCRKQQPTATNDNDVPTNENVPESSAHNENERVYPTLEAVDITGMKPTTNHKKVTPGVGADPTKPPSKKAKELRRERHMMKSDNQQTSKTSSLQPKPLEDFIPHLIKLPEEARNRLEVRTVRASLDDADFLATKDESLVVYRKYQTTIHKDNESDCNEAQWLRFLVHSPINAVGTDPTLGSYHQHYLLNGRIIAVGVLDILPRCASSVYLYYDPDYGFLSLGVYSALSEVAYSRHLYTLNNNIEFYYMGFYIQSCQKMRYKGKYEPSELLCPETYNWVPVPNCVEALDNNKYCRLNELNGGPPDAVDEASRNVSLSNVGILYDRTLYRFDRYIMEKYFSNQIGDGIADAQEKLTRIESKLEKDKSDLTEYYKLVGKQCAHRMFLYRPMLLELDDDDE